MIEISVSVDGENAWPDLKDKAVRQAERLSVAALVGGMHSGRTSVSLRLDLPDGEVVIAQTSLRLFLLVADTLRARYGTNIN